MTFVSFIIAFNTNKIPMLIAAPTVASEAKCAPITTLLIVTKVPQTIAAINANLWKFIVYLETNKVKNIIIQAAMASLHHMRETRTERIILF